MMDSVIHLKEYIEIEFLKSLSYEEINEIMHKFAIKIAELEKELNAKDRSEYK